MIHLMYGCIRNHSSAKCGQFLEMSTASYLFQSYSTTTLNSDSDYFEYMGNDNVKTKYFSNLITNMRKKYPNFGRACYVDSTPLPNESEGFPYTALCSHGTDGLTMQARLGLVLDIETGIPVWFHVFSSNILDHSTLMDIQIDIKETLGIDIDVAALDAGYACRELFDSYNIDNNTYTDEKGNILDRYIVIRMPDKNGYPHDELYLECKSRLYSALHLFDYNGHAYFGERFEREIFGNKEYCYVFLDRKQAEDLGGKWRVEHPDEWEALCDTDKEWYSVKDGFFILICSKLQSPRETLIEYKARGHVEGFFKDGKSYTDILPLASWTKPTILGKILHDVIQTTVYRLFRKEMSSIGTSVKYFLSEMQSLDCVIQGNGQCKVFTPKKQVRDYYQTLGYTVPAFMELAPFREEIMHGTPMDRTPVTMVKKQAGRKPKEGRAASPEERERIRCLKKAKKEIEKNYKKVINKSANDYKKALKKAELKLEKALSQAALKKEAILNNHNGGDAPVAKAGDDYKLAVAAAEKRHDIETTEALKLREQVQVKAKQEYEAAIAACEAQYENTSNRTMISFVQSTDNL